MALCTVTGAVYLPSGKLARSVTIKFSRVDKSVNAEYLGAVVPADVFVKTDRLGQVDFQILTGKYIMAVGEYSGGAVVPEELTANIADILTIAVPGEQLPIWLEQAFAARDAALSAAADAQGSADDAADSADQAAADAVVGSAALVVANRAEGKADDALLASDAARAAPFIAFPSYAAALAGAGSVPPPVLVISADVGGIETRWVRSVGGTALGGGWIPAGDATPEHFGAVGNGVASDTASVQAWLSYVIANSLNAVIPARDYLLDGPVSVTFSNKQFSLTGCGIGASRFIVTGLGGLLMDATDRASQFTGRDFSVIARGISRGTGLRFTLVPGGNQHQRSVVLDNVEAKGEAIATDCFDTFIDLTGNWRPLVRGCVSGGPFGPGVSSDQSDSSPMFTATAGIVIDDCYDPSIENCHVWSAYTGISSIGTDQEALRITNTVINGVRVALDFFRTTREPIIWIDNCHWNYRDDGLKIDGARLIVIRGSHPYNEDLTNQYTGVPHDIWLKNTERVIISDNIFHFDGHTGRINVFFDASVSANGLICTGNIFGARAAEAVRVSVGASNVHISDNQFPGTIGVRVNDLSSAALISGASGTGEYTIENQADSSASSPILNLYRNSDSPAANDALATIRARGNDSVGAVTDYASLRGVITSPTDGAEAGEWQFFALIAGALSRQLTVGAGVQIGAATGGNRGSGSLNVAAGYHINGAAGATGTFTTTDGKTITVTGGIVTGIA